MQVESEKLCFFGIGFQSTNGKFGGLGWFGGFKF